jgi:hypothetical protein
MGDNAGVAPETSRAWTLPAAAGLAAVEAAALIAVIVFVGDRLPIYAVFMAVKFPLCLWLVRRHPGAFLAVLLWELWGLGLAVVAHGVPLALRVVEVGLATTVIALLWASAPLFPSPRLPER